MSALIDNVYLYTCGSCTIHGAWNTQKHRNINRLHIYHSGKLYYTNGAHKIPIYHEHLYLFPPCPQRGEFRAAQARSPHPGKKEDHPQGGPPFYAFCRRAAFLTPS